MHYLIDGYNLLHVLARGARLKNAGFESARDKVVDAVARYCAHTGHRASIVFDGRRQRADAHAQAHAAGSVETLFTPAHQSADAYIERRVFESPDRGGLVVVTGDRGIRDLCFNLGALVMGPENFHRAVREAVTEERGVISQHHRKYDIHRLEQRLGKSARARLERLRAKLE